MTAIDRAKLDELYGVICDMAFFLLEKNGEFFPIGAVVDASGEIRHVAIYDGEEHPDSNQVIAGLTEHFQQQASDGAILASAIAADVKVRPSPDAAPTDAVLVRLRSSDFARDAVQPYAIETSGIFKKTRKIVQGNPTANAAEQDVFGS